MKQSERASIMRILTDLIEADGIIDTKEIVILNKIREKYGIKKTDEILASSYTLGMALEILFLSSEKLKHDLMEDFFELSLSDDFCAKEEALLMLTLRLFLTNAFVCETKVISVSTESLFFDSGQILYVESEYDSTINKDIVQLYREISNEIRLSGFHFVYLPKIAKLYRSVSDIDFMGIATFLYPKVSVERLNIIFNQIQNLSTAEFCKYQLGAKLNMKELENISPSFMIHIGNSYVNDKPMSNFLVVEIADNVLKTIRKILMLYEENYHNTQLSYLQEKNGRFIYTGFYKQIFDILMLRKGVRSSIVIDPIRERIFFQNIEMNLEGIHRREKALYALVLLESANGGVNFNKPISDKQEELYNKRIHSLQNKYRIIYKKFGGDENKAPNIMLPEIRLPMIALLKKQLLKMKNILLDVEDYIICRNAYGNYNVGISALLCYCRDIDDNIVPLMEAKEWREIAAL